MSTTIDNRVVEMQFDNRQFEKNVSTSLSTLDKLKQALNFDKSSKSLNDFSKATGKFNLDGIASAVNDVSERFNAFGIIGITALQRITNSAITAGKQIVSALTIDPIKTGLSEYETKIGAIQVIRANDQTASMGDISAALNELNTYADKTIYNFAQMTSNVGKFVAQGLGVKEAANAVRGMANLAAASGASASDMARATYQMSQALGGVIRKIDVNSLRNANMWTTTLKDALVDVARAEGVAIDEMIKEKGTLEETLEKGWLTGEMFTKVMNIYSGVYDEAQLRAMGFNDEQIKKFQQIAKTAEEAAVEIKTLSQLWDTLKENVQSGWTQTWELVIGNFEEAKQLWTDVSEILSDFTNKMADRRNALLEGWKNLGGRDYFITGMLNVLYSLLFVLDTVSDAFHDIFPEMTVQRLFDITKQFKHFTEMLMLSDEGAAELRTVLGGVFSVVNIGMQIFSAFVYGLKELLRIFSPIIDAVKNLIVSVSGMTTAFAKSNTVGETLRKGLEKVVQFIENNFGGAIQFIADKINALANVESPFAKIGKSAEEATEKVSILDKVIDGVKTVFSTLKGLFSNFGPTIASIAHTLAGAFDAIADSIVNAFKNADVNTALDFLKTGLLVGLGVGLKKLIDKITSPISIFKDLVGNISDVLGSVGDAFQSFSSRVKAGLILKIGIAIGILAGSLLVLSGIDPASLAKGIVAIIALFGELFRMLALLEKYLGNAKFRGATKIATTMIGISVAVLILASALKKLAAIDVQDLGKGLLAVTVLLGEVVAAAIGLSKFGGKIKTSAVGMILFAAAINVLVVAVRKLGETKPEVLAQGLKSVAILMAELVAFMVGAKFGKFGVGTGLAMIELAAALLIMQKAVEKFGSLDFNIVENGLIAIAGLLVILAAAMNMMPKGMPIIATGLILVGAALNIMSGALQSFGGMSLPEIGKGLLVLAGSLTILALALNGMVGTLAGSAALLIASGALAILAPVLERLGKLSLAEIGKALLTMAGAFVVLGVAGAVLAPLLPVILGLSAALLLVSVAVGVASAALTAFVVALTALSVAGPAVVTAIAAMIPLILSSIGDGFAAFIDAIAKNAVTIANAFKDILVAIVNAIGEAIPTIVNTAGTLLSSLLNTFLTYVPQMVDAGLQLITGILQGIASNIQGIVEAAIDVVVNFIEGVASKLPDVIQAGFDLVIAFINGLADAIRNNTHLVVDAVSNMFDAVVDASIEIITGSIGRFIQAGADAVGGLIKGIGSGIGGVGKAMANVGGKALGALADTVGWHSPWESTYGMGVDGNRGLANGLVDSRDISVNAAKRNGIEVIKTLDSTLSRGYSELQRKYGYNNIVGKYDPDAGGNRRIKSRRQLQDLKNGLYDVEEVADDTAKENKKLENSFANLGGGKGSSGGSKGSGAASATKEVKKLFDAMTDGEKVVKKFAEHVGDAYKTAGYTNPLEMGQAAVQKLAEKIYAASVKTVDAETQMAKTSEEKLAEMREAFIKYQDDVKGTITGQADIWGGLTQKAAITTKDWTKNLKTQRMWVGQWEKDLSYAAERLNDENIMSWIIEQGPAFDMQLKKLLSSSEEEFRAWEEQISSLDTLYDDAVNAAMAAYAEYYTKLEGSTEESVGVVEKNWQEIGQVVWEAGEDHAKVVKDMIDGNQKIGESAEKMATVTKQAIEGAMYDYMSMRDTVKNTVDDQIDLFSKFDTDTELSGDDLHDNMKSQIDGIRDWSAGMTELLDRGLDRGLYQKLAEMGPKSYEYVQAFLDMTAEQLNDANAYFEQSLTIGDEIGQQLGSDFAVAGLMASEGFKQGIDQNAGVAEVKQMALNVVNAFRGDLDIHSPSGVFMGFGQNLDEGLTRGITMYQTGPIGAISTMAKLVIDRARTEFSEQQFYVIGQNIAQGLARGIESSSSIVTAAAAHVMQEAIAAAEEAAGIASPSKEFARLGMYSDLGLAKGFTDNADSVDAAATSVANSALNSMRAVVGHISDIINGEVVVDPTIRPVLDLSGVEAGASAISSMFGGTSYGMSRGINIQNRSDSINDLINQMSMSQAAFATPGGANINMYVYGAQGQSEEELANIIEQKLMFRLNRTGAVWT